MKQVLVFCFSASVTYFALTAIYDLRNIDLTVKTAKNQVASIKQIHNGVYDSRSMRHIANIDDEPTGGVPVHGAPKLGDEALNQDNGHENAVMLAPPTAKANAFATAKRQGLQAKNTFNKQPLRQPQRAVGSAHNLNDGDAGVPDLTHLVGGK